MGTLQSNGTILLSINVAFSKSAVLLKLMHSRAALFLPPGFRLMET